jgi:GT2 family glycosyltransferase
MLDNCELAAPHVQVVVVTWNSEADIDECLRHLSNNTDYPNFHVAVIDNSSSDETTARVRAWAPFARLISHATNEGWIGALNHALASFQSDFFVFLNPDARVQSQWLQPLVEVAVRGSPLVAAVAPKFRYPDGRIQSVGFKVSRTFSIEPRGHGELDRGQFDGERNVPMCSGMMLLSGQAAGRIGPVDAGYGLGYFEDMDYSLRARYLGYSIGCAPESVIVHGEGRSFERLGAERQRILTGNRLRFMTLHWPLRWLVARLAFEVVKPIQAVAAGREVRPILDAWWRWAGSLPALVRMRQRLIRGRARGVMSSLR